MIGFKNREVIIGKRSRAYFNLHRKVFSIEQSGLVVLHAKTVRLTECKFSVEQAGREKVIRTGTKNVHARVIGKLAEIDGQSVPEGFRAAYYNPKKVTTFVDMETGEEIGTASEVILIDKKIFYKK